MYMHSDLLEGRHTYIHTYINPYIYIYIYSTELLDGSFQDDGMGTHTYALYLDRYQSHTLVQITYSHRHIHTSVRIITCTTHTHTHRCKSLMGTQIASP